MAFDWQRFLSQNRIPFKTESATDIAVRCPLCRDDDPSFHMSVSLQGRGWSCWRNAAHRGRNRARLIQHLLKCSPEHARSLAGMDTVVAPVDEDFVGAVAGLLGMEEGLTARPGSRLELPKEFKPMSNNSKLSEPFWDYLYDRGYNDADAEWVVDKYELHYCLKGPYAYRVIAPLRDAAGQLITWTGRSIVPEEELRYRTLPLNPRPGYNGPLAKAAPGSLLLGLPLLWSCRNPKVLVISEGPFDGFRLSALGHHLGIYGTCLFGLNLSEDQALLLDGLAQRFERMFLLLDEGAEFNAFRMMSKLAALPTIKLWKLPRGSKDPGAFSEKAANDLFGGLLAAA